MKKPANVETKSESPAEPVTIVPKKKPGPCSPLLTPRIKAEICALLRIGCSRYRVAVTMGFSPTKLKNELRRDPEFAAEVHKAEVQQEIVLLKRVHDVSKEPAYWRAAAWLLERKYPDRYAKRAPRTMTPEQVATVLGQFAEILTRGIHNAQDRNKVGNELKLLTSAITQQAAGDSSS